MTDQLGPALGLQILLRRNMVYDLDVTLPWRNREDSLEDSLLLSLESSLVPLLWDNIRIRGTTPDETWARQIEP